MQRNKFDGSILVVTVCVLLLSACSVADKAAPGRKKVDYKKSKPTDTLRRRAESDAYDFIADYTESQAEAGIRGQALSDLKLVADVLAATDIARKQEAASGQLCSFARVEEIIGNLYAKNND